MKIEVDFKTLYVLLGTVDAVSSESIALLKQVTAKLASLEEYLVDYYCMSTEAAHKHVVEALERDKLCYIKYGNGGSFAAIDFKTNKSPAAVDHGKAAASGAVSNGVVWCADPALMKAALIRNGWLVVDAPKETS